MKSGVVTLNENERWLAAFIAKKRYTINRSMRVKNQRQGAQGDIVTDIEGAMGELAFCKLANCYTRLLDTDDYAVWDAVDGRVTVDVKTTRFSSGHLVIRDGKVAKPADFYVLMIGCIGRYEYAGCCTAQAAFADAHRQDRGNGPAWWVPQSELVQELPRDAAATMGEVAR